MKKRWIDETGLEIPVNRITATERLRESAAEKLLAKAKRLNAALEAFKAESAELCKKVWLESLKDAGMDEAKVKEHKGNHTWYNFDRSIKVEVSVKDRIDFDDALITAAKEKFDEFLSNNTSGTDEVIRHLIMDAFSTTRGKLDAKKVMSLLRHRSRISKDKYPDFHAAADLVEQSMRRPDSREYIRIWERNEKGEYNNVDLNFSSI